MIAIPLLTLVPGRLGGSETYVRELLAGLGRTGRHDYRVVLPPVAPAASAGLPSVVAPEYRAARTTPQRLLAMGEAWARPARLRRHVEDAAVLHYPLTIRLPPVDRPSVATLHDLQHLDLPAMFPRSERLFRRAVWHPSLRGAERVVVISEFVRGRAEELLGLDPKRLRVVPLGLDHERLRPGGERGDYLLYPARRWPHKNHERLFEAFALLRRERPGLRLVLTGGGDFSRCPEGVEARGHLPWHEVVELLRHAAALVFPSLYEGFGLPPLEAMACGCPVACSDVAALPEVVGDAARLFDPRDPRSIADAVLDVLAEPDEWAARGLVRAQAFSWDATARATDEVYSELL